MYFVLSKPDMFEVEAIKLACRQVELNKECGGSYSTLQVDIIVLVPME